MRNLLVLVLSLLAATVAADPLAVVAPADLHWKPYDFVGKFPAKYTVPMHSHTNECVVVMRKGAMRPRASSWSTAARRSTSSTATRTTIRDASKGRDPGFRAILAR